MAAILSNLCPNICLVPHYAWNGPIGPKLWEVTQIRIPLLAIGSLLTQVILKGSTPLERAAGLVGTCVILSNLCLNICLVPHCTLNGPIGPKTLPVTQICIPLLVVGS